MQGSFSKVLYTTEKKKNLKGEATQTPQPDYPVHQEALDPHPETFTIQNLNSLSLDFECPVLGSH